MTLSYLILIPTFVFSQTLNFQVDYFFNFSYESDKKMNCEGEEESISPRSSMRQPERGDLKCMRMEGGYHDDDPQAIIRKKQKVEHFIPINFHRKMLQ